MLWHVVAVVIPQLFTVAGGANLRTASVNAEGDADAFFTYDYSQHGTDWMMGSCTSRQRQSPVNFIEALGQPPLGTFNFKYESVGAPFELVNNGHVYSADLAGLGYGGISHNGFWYNLLNVNFHAKSEHQWGGVNMPLEVHLVHKRHDTDAMLIVAIPITCAAPPLPPPLPPATAFEQMILPVTPMPSPPYVPPLKAEADFNVALQAFLEVSLPPVNMKQIEPINSLNPLDINAFVDGGTYMEYSGSMTGPPCAEIVTWLVRREPIMASNMQVMDLHNGIYKMTGDFGNDRAVMPLNGRPVTVLTAVKQPPPPPEHGIVPPGPPMNEREYLTRKWATDALRITKTSTDYIRDLDRSLRAAAKAHADALSQPYTVSVTVPMMTTASPYATTMAPLSMENAAASMSASIYAGAHQVIHAAVREIAQQASAVAATDAWMASQGAVGAPVSPAVMR